MKPDLSNYEIWITDYLDGHLSADQTSLLMEFLTENPDISDEIKTVSGFIVRPDDKYLFPGKNLLRKTPEEMPENQFELLCIAALENDITPEQKDELDQIIAQNRNRYETFSFIHKLKLAPPAEKFRYKNKIRKKTIPVKSIRLTVTILGAAATVAFILYLSGLQTKISENNFKTATDAGIQKVKEPPEAGNSVTLAYDDLKTTGKIKDSFSSEKSIMKENLALNQTENDFTALIPESLITRETVIRPVDFKTDIVPVFEIPAKLCPSYSVIPQNNYTGDEEPGLRKQIYAFIRGKVLGIEDKPAEKIKAYELAEAGVNGINKLLGWQMAFNEYTDETGDLTAISFSSKLIKFNLPVKKSESGE